MKVKQEYINPIILCIFSNLAPKSKKDKMNGVSKCFITPPPSVLKILWMSSIQIAHRNGRYVTVLVVLIRITSIHSPNGHCGTIARIGLLQAVKAKENEIVSQIRRIIVAISAMSVVGLKQADYCYMPTATITVLRPQFKTMRLPKEQHGAYLFYFIISQSKAYLLPSLD